MMLNDHTFEWNMPTWTCKKEQYHFHCHLVLSNVQTTIVIEHSCYTTISFYGTSMPSIIVCTNPSINIILKMHEHTMKAHVLET